MVAELLTGLNVFKTMLDTARGLKDINDATVRNSSILDLQQKILDAQSQQTALIERIAQLERQVASFESWDREKSRYQLTDFGSGTFAYALKPEARNGEPDHRICPACYQRDRKAILQFTGRNVMMQDVYRCSECEEEFNLGNQHEPDWSRSAGETDSWLQR